MSTNALAIKIVNSVADAPHYNRDHPDIRVASIDRAIIVKGGTVAGKTTVDFQIKDAEGNEYVAMITGALVRALAAAVVAAEEG